MSKQCLSIEQMQHLKDLGVDTSNATACWFRVLGIGDLRVFTVWSLAFNKYITKTEGIDTQIVPTFTLQDILDLLPTEIEKENRNYQLDVFRNPQRYFVSYYWCDNLLMSSNEVEFIDAAYEMLCWCIESGYVKTNKED